jgi:hypothetical protein
VTVLSSFGATIYPRGRELVAIVRGSFTIHEQCGRTESRDTRQPHELDWHGTCRLS